MADEWQPTTDLETLLVGAIDAADPEGYFRVLAGADLIVPLPPETAEQVLADTVQPVWPTQEVDGRTHVLAYTSPEAMRAHLGPRFQHHLRLRFADVAAAWPHSHWWLAVDLTLPPQALLPSWFLRQVADGDPRPVLLGLPRPAAPPRAVPVPPPGAADPLGPDSPAVQSALAAVQESGSLQDATQQAAKVLAALRGLSAPADVPAPPAPGVPAGREAAHASGPAAPVEMPHLEAPGPASGQVPFPGDAPRTPGTPEQSTPRQGEPNPVSVQPVQADGLPGAPGVSPEPGIPSAGAPHSFASAEQTRLPGAPAGPEGPYAGTPLPADSPDRLPRAGGIPGPVTPGALPEQGTPYTGPPQTTAPAFPDRTPPAGDIPGTAAPGMPGAENTSSEPPAQAGDTPGASAEAPQASGSPTAPAGAVPGAPAEHTSPRPEAPQASDTAGQTLPAGPALPGTPEAPADQTISPAGEPRTAASPERTLPAEAVPSSAPTTPGTLRAGAAQAADSPEQASSAGNTAPGAPGADTRQDALRTGAPQTTDVPEHVASAGNTIPGTPAEPETPHDTVASPEQAAAAEDTAPGAPAGQEAPHIVGSLEPAATPKGAAPEVPAEPEAPHTAAPQTVALPEQGSSGGAMTSDMPAGPEGPYAGVASAGDGASGAASEREGFAGGPDSGEASEPAPSAEEAPGVPGAVTGQEIPGSGRPEPDASSERNEGSGADGGQEPPQSGVPMPEVPMPEVPVAPVTGPERSGGEIPDAVAALLGRQEPEQHGSVPDAVPDDGARVFGSAEHARGPAAGDDPAQTQIDGLPPIVEEIRTEPAAGGPERAAASAGRGRFLPANPVETELVRAADEESLVKALMGAELLLPVPPGTDAAARPSRPGFPWQPGEIDGTPAVPAFTSPERLLDVIGQVDYVRVPFPIVVRHWPDLGWTLAINPGTPASATLTGQQLPLVSTWVDQLALERPGFFSPQNELEQRLHEAAQRRDAETFFGLLTSAQVMIPADPDTPWGARPGEPDFPWHPVPLKGEQAIMAFTSPRWMHEAVGQSRFVMPDFRELAANWPEHGWALVLNPGTPIDLTVPGDRLRAAVAPAEPQRARPAHFEPGNRVDQDLDEAVLAGDTDDFLRVTLAAQVLVPVPATAPEELSPEHPDFDWSAALSASPPGPGASVRVFTSHLRLQETVGDIRYVTVGFTDLISHWRRTDWTLHLNPGTRIGASLTGGQVRELSEWAVSVGLPVRQGQHRELAQPYAAPHAPAEAGVSPEAGISPEATSAENPIVEIPAPRERGPQVMVMQKVLPHGHVGWYLEQGYDRVGGFIHPLADCAELATPAQLYQALGLLYPESPFSLSDEAVYVLRWHAHCEDLYRVPFGGRTEEELHAWGEAGWVIEHGPFQGDGFAPGSAGSIREFKSDSTRLPTGAELYLIGGDGTATLVAVYDADVLGWTSAQQPKEVPQ
ncbi:SseB family protein [Actinocorallia sp. B10E7]|uniref:SseB family protein n=1 Tax=Actinocorallia sp. B10E7 TaxID=3153558 RepID=UPI00325F5ECE